MSVNERYTRQFLIPQVGEEGQRKWCSSRVLVVGAGGLGCPLLMALAGAGIGAITVMDGDTVSESNLNRQFLYTPPEIGKPKAEFAAAKLRAYSPKTEVSVIPQNLTRQNAGEILCGYDLVLPAVDNVPTRLLINEFCAQSKTPLVNGGVEGLYGNVMTVQFGVTACLACLYAGRETEKGGKASLGAVCMTVASLMANAALLLLLGENPLAGKLLLYDGSRLCTELVSLTASPGCPVCGKMH